MMHTAPHTRRRTAAALLCGTILLAAVATACGDAPARSGGSAAPTALRSTYANGRGGVGSDVLDAIVEDSSGPVTVSAPSPGFTDSSTDTDGDAIAALKAGKADLAVVRAARLFDAGATTLAPLQAPFVVTSPEQAARIAADPIATEMLAGLDRAGLVGIALVDGGLRHPFGYQKALVDVSDFRGKAINSRPGTGVDGILTALGATADHSVGSDRSAAAASGKLGGIEVSLQQSQAVDRPAVLTSNVTLYDKFDVVVVRKAAFDALTGAQQKALRGVVAAGVTKALSARPTEAAALATWCDQPNASAVTASPAALSNLQSATRPVLDAMMADPFAKKAIDRMRDLGRGTTPPAGTECAGPVQGAGAEAAYRVTPEGDQSVLDGVWRLQSTKADLLAAGATPNEANVNAGVWTFTIHDGIAKVDQPSGPDCEMQFAFAGKRVSLDQSVNGNDSCGGVGLGTYRLSGDDVTFHWTKQMEYHVELDQGMFKHGMHRVSDG